MLTDLEQATLEKLHKNIKHTEALFEGAPCWEWQMSCMKAGYGQLFVAGKNNYTHRLMYQLMTGPIPEGLELDHLCRNRKCCNPAHLEAVTSKENTRRGQSNEASKNKTHCKQGHEFTPENTRRHKSTGGRYCRTCMNARGKARKAKYRAEAKAAKLAAQS